MDAYEFSIDSWLGNAKADEVVVYTDHPDLERLAKPRPRVRFVYAFSPSVEVFSEFPWNRKAEAIQAYFEQTGHPNFVYLDCDCWVRDSFPEVFRDMQFHDIAGTRLLGRDKRGKGEANAGVIFFRNSPSLPHFFNLWRTRLEDYRRSKLERFYEQSALSHLMIESFDGLHDFRSTLVSERIYNCEDDDDQRWLETIERYQPKIIHFKKKRFRNSALITAVAQRISRGAASRVPLLPPQGMTHDPTA
jgi:hypothetical protein